LLAEKSDETDHNKITKQDKTSPGQKRRKPRTPGDMPEDLQPPHLTPLRKAIIKAIYGLLALGIQGLRKKWLKDLLPPVFNGGEVIGY
jgi:hypothetical protein